MALLHFEGFDNFATYVEVNSAYPASNVPNNGFVANGGRFGGGALLGSSSNPTFKFELASTPSTVIAGFAFYTSAFLTDNTLVTFQMADGTSGTFALRILSDGRIKASVYLGADVATSTLKLKRYLWQHIEVKHFANGSTGTIEVRVDGITFLSFTGNTTGSGTAIAYVSYVGWTGTKFDDCYVLDTTGSTANDFLGDSRVRSSLPTATPTQGSTPVGAATAHEAVDDVSPDTTTYTEFDGGEIDYYDLADIPTTVTVHGVRVYGVVKKSDAGVRSIKVGGRSNGVVSETSAQTLYTEYLTFWHQMVTNPDGNVAWTPATFNALQAKIEAV